MNQPGQGRTIRHFLLLLALAGLIVYVAAEAIRGAHGLVANKQLNARIDALSKELASLKAERAKLERDAALLGPKAATEPALLDEQARSLLDLANPNDIVVVNGDKRAN
jgi:cell division protein FtsB